jgi:hypothetical protein
MDANSDLILLIGRIEGKVDTLVSMQASTTQRVDQIETRTSQLEQKMAAATASGTSTSAWIGSLISVGAVLIALAIPFIERLLK